MVVAILDQLSLAEAPVVLNDLLTELRKVIEFSDREKLLTLVKLHVHLPLLLEIGAWLQVVGGCAVKQFGGLR